MTVAWLLAATVVSAAPGQARTRIADLVLVTSPDIAPSSLKDLPITSWAGYLYDSGSTNPGVAALGEILNLTGSRRTGITVRADFYVGTILVGSLVGPVVFEGLAWGSRSPFLISSDNPPFPASGVDGFIVTVEDEGVGTSVPPAGALDIIRGPTTVDSVAQIRWFTGTIRNPNPVAVTVPGVTISTWDAGDAILDVGVANVDPQTIPAGATATYGVPLFYDPLEPVTRSMVEVDGATATDMYVTDWANYFDDVGTSPFRTQIVWIAEQGITTGCGPGLYCPSANVPRDQMASFLARASHLAGAAPDAFTDDDTNIHEPNIDLVAKAGVTTGCGPGLYCPSANVPRDQMASFLARATHLTGAAPDAFTDDDANIHEPNIDLVAQAGITTGCGGGLYCPSMLVTREQMAAFLRRAFD